MAVQSALTLNTKVYNPRGVGDGIAKWALVGDASFGGASSTVTTSIRGPSKDGIYRVRLTLSVPKAATADSACACVGQTLGTLNGSVELIIPAAFSAAERQDYADRMQGLIANALFDALVANLEPSW